MSVPFKYRTIGDFHEYYSGVRKAPYLTIFVGGNHEASNHLWELYYGGWVAPKIYYLGAANVIRVGPLRVAGLSGIWKGHDYNKPHHERLPYSQNDLKSIYHVRELDARKLLQIKTQVDVGISHDWPRGVEWMGDWKALFAKKDLFEADARAGTLGSAAAKYVMDRLRPPHWFAAHLHCKFAAGVKYGGTAQAVQQKTHELVGQVGNKVQLSGDEPGVGLDHPEVPKPSAQTHNDDEIELDVDDEEPVKVPASTALNSCSPKHASPIDFDDSQVPKPSAPAHNEDEIELDIGDDEPVKVSASIVLDSPRTKHASPATSKSEIVPAHLRAQLPASFAPSTTRSSPPSLPHPEAIANKTTLFLALDKCLPNRKFLQILDIEPISQPPPNDVTPYSTLPISYDKEWLAITRVFAPELILGPSSSVTRNKGEAHYAPLIAAEEQWVEANIVKKGLLAIPENFDITAPVYDPNIDNIEVREQPREYTNPQTVTFCNLVGIPNPFHASEEERDERVRNGPPVESSRGGGWMGRGRGRGSGGDRGRGRGRGRGKGSGYR